MSTTPVNMPYNTRRKSLSLADLGITVPKRSRTASHPSPPTTIAEGDERPVKKTKRSHATNSPPPGLMSPPRTTTIRFKDEKPRHVKVLSPPPSPGAEGANKVDLEGINDNIVAATIRQLEGTANRPMLVKELAILLASELHCVEKSANPCALISSRLTAYLNRSWPAISKCPLAKDLSAVHPRRLYFYLTTTQHQPIPDVPPPLPELKRTLSPPQSSASAADEEEHYTRQRNAMSPSPEVDLSSPELEENNIEPPSPGAPFSSRNSVSRESRSSSFSQKRAASPQLEREERDFKQTASHLHEQAQLRRNSKEEDVKMEGHDGSADDDSVTISIEESEESAALKHSDDAAALFGNGEHLLLPPTSMEFSSPVIQPQQNELRHGTMASPIKLELIVPSHDRMILDLDTKTDLILRDSAFGFDALQSPENIELAELDDMFDAY
ncbi:hypothetical protein LTR62_007666 [Meristemomyces frigidus]|uniref:GDS1 winged helix domain-containing protein n=1 Tax=Meristemomyces frigidus TaxID=1508187 RepID=A0AAN7YNT7_9PEZI|nr:hypothetical protein LTR62_007666 [Meristemomyces frigidus]